MINRRRRCDAVWLAVMVSAAAAAHAAEADNLMGFVHGTVPVRVEGPAQARVTLEQAIRAIDGSAHVYTLTRPVPPETRIVMVYALAAPTVFHRMAVPGVLETPSPNQTFVRDVRVSGSALSADDGFVPMASGTLTAHAARGQQTELTLQAHEPVRWVRLEVGQGLHTPVPAVTLEFSELIGEGRQEPVPVPAAFAGHWETRGLSLQLAQQDAVVTGCYDKGQGRLQGTVSGRVLRATGLDTRTGVPSAFIGVLQPGGPLQVMRSSNGAPFYLFSAGVSSRAAGACAEDRPPTLGCGSVVHGISFDFDSATLRADAAPVLAALHQGLLQDGSSQVQITGHTSSEGDAAYNQALSGRRAQAVVDELVQRGLPRSRLSAAGAGESRPIAPNDAEIGRALNRRVEVSCK